MLNRRKRAWVAPLLLLVAVGLGVAFWDQAAFNAWKAGLNPWLFFLLMLVLPAFGVPTSPFYLIAGISFGPWVGLGGGALAIAGNLLLVYAIGQSGLRRMIDRCFQGYNYRLPTEAPKKPLRYAILVKLTPGVPATLKNYALVFSHVSFPLYFWVSFVFSFAYAVMFYLLGDSFGDRDGKRGLTVIAVILAAVAIGFYLSKRRNSQTEKQPNETA